MENLIEITIEEGIKGKIQLISSVNTLFFFKKLPDNGKLYLYSTAELTAKHTLMLEKSANVTLLEHHLISDFLNFREYTFLRNEGFETVYNFHEAVETMMVEYDL